MWVGSEDLDIFIFLVYRLNKPLNIKFFTMKKDLTDAGRVKAYVVAQLYRIGFEKTEDRKEVKDDVFFVSQPSGSSKSVVFTLASKEQVNKIRPEMKSAGIIIEPSAEKPENFKVNIRSACKIIPKSFVQGADMGTLSEQRPLTVAVDKSKERLAIEALLDTNAIAYDSEKCSDTETELIMVFADEEAFIKAQQVLSEHNLDCVAWDGPYELLISLAIPDAMLSGVIAEETADQKIERIATDYEIRLQVSLQRKLGLSIHSVGGVSRKLRAANHITYAADGNIRRLDFYDVKSKERAWAFLVEVGFACQNPVNKEKTTIIVDLANSDQKVLLQNISTEKLTLQEISLKLAGNPELVRGSVGHKILNNIRYYVQFFATEQQAIIAADSLKLEVDGVVAYKKGLCIPFTSIRPSRKSPTKKAVSEKSTPQSVPAAQQPAVVVTGSSSDDLLTQYKAMLREEISKEYKDRIEQLEAALKVAQDKFEKNYLIAKNGTPAITIPISEINKGVMIDGVKGVVTINKVLLLQ